MDFVFSTNATVASLDAVPVDFRGMYQEVTEGDDKGKFALSEAHKPAALAIDGFNKTNKALRTEVGNLKGRQIPDLAPWLGLAGVVGLPEGEEVTVDSIKAAIEKLQASPGTAKANYDRMVKDLTSAHERALKAKDGEVSVANAAVSRYIVDNQAIAAITAAGGVPKILLPHIKECTRVDKEGEEFRVRIVDEAGATRGGPTGANMTIPELVAELKADPIYGRCFASEARSSAAGSPNPGSAGSAAAAAARAAASGDKKLNPTARIAAGLAARDAAKR